MAEEKRQIGDYTEELSIRFGHKELIVGTSDKAEWPFVVCDCTSNNPFSLDIFTNAIGTDDYLEAMSELTRRLNEQIAELREERAATNIDAKPLTAEDCIPKGMDKGIEGKLIVLRADSLRPEFRNEIHQLALATGGFGCTANSRGRAVYVESLADGQRSRWNREDILGVMNPERLPAWAKEKLEQLKTAEHPRSVKDGLKLAKASVKPPAPTDKGKGHDPAL